jgi:hypothetical protein
MSAAEFIAARDILFSHGTNYATAYRDFRWPGLRAGERGLREFWEEDFPELR